MPSVVVYLTQANGELRKSSVSDERGRFAFVLLPPDTYRLQAEKGDFEPLSLSDLQISVTETLRVALHLRLSTRIEHVEAVSDPGVLQTDSFASGQVVDNGVITELPLVTRNFAQIIGLSAGVTVRVTNAGELGLGGTPLSQIAKSNDGIYVHGARSYDNNFILDGISVSDVQGSSSGSGGIPLPNPDAIEEFKVQTGLYDAGFGRYAGASTSLITKTGSGTYHGALFEFVRNNLLNANDFFLNKTRQARPDLKQNQLGVTLGGPIKKKELFLLGSYQGTWQTNGLAAGQARVACTANLTMPPLTNDRSPAALGKLFGGMTGTMGGVAVNRDGSNINPVAIALLNLKSADGNYLIPTPHSVDPSKSFALQGFSTFAQPCHFRENQMLVNTDYVASSKSRFAERFFLSDESETISFPGNGLNPSGNIPGFPSPAFSGFRVVSLANTYVLTDRWLNQIRFGYVRARTRTGAMSAFKWSDVGVAEGEMNRNNELPSLNILGSISVASGFPRTITQNSYIFDDVLSIVYGAHILQAGGSTTRVDDNLSLVGLGSFLDFLSWPDFLLGLNGASNGTGFSNVFASFDVFGLTDREYRAWEGSSFVQDNYRAARALTLNIGLRYEHLGQFSDQLGRNSSFAFNKANANPPGAGSVDGYIVASNFRGAVPQGVLRANNTFGNYGRGQNAIAPRIGFAWQVWRHKTPLVLRGGWGTYYSRTTGQAFYQNVFGAPFSEFRLNSGAANASATLQTPFAQPFPGPDSFPSFPAYSPTTRTTIYSVSPDFRPAIIQQFSLNVQVELHPGWLLETAYVGTRGTHLVRQRSLNQALSANSDSPMGDITSNTLANVSQRVPIPGVPPDSLLVMESEGNSWYNALEVSGKKHLSHRFEFLASYTFSKTLDTDGADINSTSTGNALTLGNQNYPGQRWGRASFDCRHRFVFSTIWTLPTPVHRLQRAIAGGWSLAAVAVIQSGNALTIAYTNSKNLFGISEDRAQLSGRCSNGQLVTGGSVKSKVNDYFNLSCFTTPPVIGADGIGTAFGNSGTGIVDGPGQENLDIALSKTIELKWPVENSRVQLRAEFFNAFNHPQFSNPDTNFASTTFGVISSTSVNARVGQCAIKFIF